MAVCAAVASAYQVPVPSDNGGSRSFGHAQRLRVVPLSSHVATAGITIMVSSAVITTSIVAEVGNGNVPFTEEKKSQYVPSDGMAANVPLPDAVLNICWSSNVKSAFA